MNGKSVMRKTLCVMLIAFVIAQFFVIFPINAPIYPIGDPIYTQVNPFESNPTAGTTSGVVGLVGSEANARDGDFGSNVNWRIGGALSSVTAYLEMQTFENNPPSGQFTIGWVDIKLNYKASATTDDRYRIVYQVAPSADWRVLEYMRLAPFRSAGPFFEEHTEEVEVNGIYDSGESIYKDVDRSRTVTAGDVLLLGAGQPVGTALVEFAADEKHTETVSWNDEFNSGESVYRDVDSSNTHTDVDIWLGGPVEQAGWIRGAVAKFDNVGDQDERAWSNVAEPNDGAWDWTDIGNLKVRVETNRVGATEDSTINRFYLYDVWAAIYEGSYPPMDPTSVSIQPPVVAGLGNGSIFFVDVFVTNVSRMFGFQFRIFYNTTVLTAIDGEYFAYSPFNTGAPSEINDDPWGNGTGYASIAQGSFMGDSVGFTGSGPVLRIYFIVDTNGTSLFHFQKTIVTTVLGAGISHTISDGVFATNPVHDVAVTDVDVSATQVMPGGSIDVDVTVVNQGTFPETFNVTAFYDSTVIGTPQTVSLSLVESLVVTFEWNTSGLGGHYTIKAVADTVSGETETSDNTFTDGTVIVGKHDVAVTDVLRAYPTPDVAIPSSVTYLNVTQGEKIYVNITVANLGTFTETFNVTARYYSGDEPLPGYRIVGTKTDVTLSPGASLTLNFTWDTTTVKFRDPRPKQPPETGYIYYNTTDCLVQGNITYVPYELGTDYDFRGNNVRSDGKANITRSAPTASFTVGTGEPYVSQPVTFDASRSITTMATTITQFDWDFGDGTKRTYVVGDNTTLPHITTYSYAAAGTYEVNLTVWNNVGFNDTQTYPYDLKVLLRDISVLSVAPAATTAIIGEPLDISVTIKNWCEKTEDSINVTVYYGDTRIDAVNGSLYRGGVFIDYFTPKNTTFTLDIVDSPADSATLVFVWNTSGLSPGVYPIRAVATPKPISGTEDYEVDKADNTFVFESVEFFNAPVASFSYSPSKPFVDQPVVFNASGSYDLDGDIVSFLWDFGDGSPAATTEVVTHNFTAKGTYTVNLTVTDNDDFVRSLVRNVTVYIRDVSVYSVEVTPLSVTEGDTVTVTVTVLNKGEQTDTFTVLVVATKEGSTEEITIDFENATDLFSGGFTTLTFEWDTTGMDAGAYTVKGVAEALWDKDTANNELVGSVVNISARTNIFLYIIAGAAVALVVVLGLAFYFMKMRKPKAR